MQVAILTLLSFACTSKQTGCHTHHNYSTGLLSTVLPMLLECMRTYLGDLREVSQVECIVALSRGGQQFSTDSVVRLNCRGHNGSTQGSQVGWPVCQETSQDGGEDGFDGCIRGGWDAELAEMAHKAGAQRLPASPCVIHTTSAAHSVDASVTVCLINISFVACLH